MYKLALLLFAVVLSGCSSQPVSTQQVQQPPVEEKVEEKKVVEKAPPEPVVETVPAKPVYEVVSVVDGDTIKVNIDGKTETLRLIGINTPETVDPRKPIQCFGKEASSKMSELVSSKKVSLEADGSAGERDKYGRLLRYVFLEDGAHVNRVLIAEGYAHEYTYNLPYKYQDEFKSAEREAREQKRGLWADDACPTTSSTPSASPPSTPTSTTPSQSNCDTNYSPCIPKYPPDLDCGDIGFPVTVIGSDPHRLDRDKDGLACE